MMEKFSAEMAKTNEKKNRGTIQKKRGVGVNTPTPLHFGGRPPCRTPPPSPYTR